MAWIKMSPAVLCPALHMSPDRSKQVPKTSCFACILKLRVSAAMTNAPMILTIVPATPLRALSYYSGPSYLGTGSFFSSPSILWRPIEI
ncbi:hypothetical protein D5086_000788 [Populus alba]|uniref:Uncharacterized protein n=1 Tax=Populus alba TaxID=43335 RepID=A0ACC4CY40_POPAL